MKHTYTAIKSIGLMLILNFFTFALAAQTWTAQTSGTTRSLSSVYFTSATQGWAVGSNGAIRTTINGGASWTAQTSGTAQFLRSVYFTSATQGWVVGDNGIIRTTTNGGTNWTGQVSLTTQVLSSVYFTSATQGWAVGGGGTILSTANGGTTWTAQTSGTTQLLISVYFTSATQGWAVGHNGTILSTTNGGTTWTAQTSGTTQILVSVYFTSATQGWAVGVNGTILSTTNGGTNWAAQTSGTTQVLYSVYFTSATQGWAVGDGGIVLTTTNGGTTWTAQTSGTTQFLRSVRFTSTTKGWAVGDSGTILAFTVVPTITSFSPTNAKPGDVVTIVGTNFNTTTTNNVVLFGATQASVTAATATSLTVTVPAGATYAPISILNTQTNLSAYSLKNFTPIYAPAKTNITVTDFLPKVDFAAGSQPYSIAIGDLDGDGKPDLVIANGGSATISVFRNISSNGSIAAGSFATKVDFTTGSQPVFVAIGDLDGDGKPDIAVANYSSANISVLRNTSTSAGITSASFANGINFTTGSNPFSIAIGDMDADGKPDLAVANRTSASISVFRNNSISGIIASNSFATKVDFTTGSLPVSVAIGDLDGDGKPDLAVTNRGSTNVSLFHNTCMSGFIDASSFATKLDFTTGDSPSSVTIGDLDGDDKPDLVVANYGTDNISVLRNTSISGSIVASSFAAKVDFPAGLNPISVALGDLDGNGKLDLAVVNDGAASVSVFRNTSISGSIGSGSFATKIDFTTGDAPRSIAIGDMDGDGKPDLAVTNQGSTSVSVFRNANLPTITSYTPASGSVGTLITVTGTDLKSTTAITIGGMAAIPISNDGTTLVAMVMPSAVTGTISVTTITGTASATGNFTVTKTPAPNTQQGSKLVGSDVVGAAKQGNSISISADGNTAIVGGRLDNSFAGAAWVYTRSGGTWNQQGSKLAGTGAVGNAQQGYSVSISADGNTAIVGGYEDNSGAGAVWVYTRSAGIWSQQGSKLVGTGAVGNAQQGTSVSISADGNTAIVGGFADNSGAGSVWVFVRSAGVWSQQGNKLVGTGAVGNGRQGISVNMSADGNTAIVGATFDNSNAGAAWIYSRSGSIWTQQGNKLIGSDVVGVARQGASVSISADGNTAIVGGFGDSGFAGAAWIYARNVSTWSQQGAKLVGTGSVANAQQGNSVSISADGNTAMVGGYDDNSGAGAAWVYARSGTTWDQQGSKLIGTGAVGAAGQGWSVSMSADGNTAVVGGNSDNSNAGATWAYNFVASTNADLSALATSSGTLSPTFAAATIGYTASVSTATTSITVTPTRAEANATITVNGTTVASASASGAISLSVGSNTITTIVTAQDGTTTKTYTITVTRAASTNANLSVLATSLGTLSPTFAAATIGYTASVNNATTSITVTPTRAEANATITVNGTTVASASASGAIALSVGSNTITTIVTAQNGTTTKTYTITVTRAASANADLSALATSSGTLSPTFAGATIGYTASVNNATTSITVTPTVSASTATVTVNGTAVTSGTASGAIALAFGDNTISTIVTAQDGTTTKTYTITVTRAKASQTITFNTLAAKTFGDVDFDAASTASSTLAPTYSSSNTSVATIVAGKIRIVGVGTSTITASQAGNASFEAATDVQQTLTVNKATATLTLSGLTPTYDGSAKLATITSIPAGLSGVVITYAGSTTAPTAAGTYAVIASLTNDNYTATNATGNLVIGKRTATLTLSGLTPTYNGNSKSATVTTNPAGLSGVSITYDGSATAPTAAGTYAVIASLTNDNYTATNATGNLVIGKGTATLTLSGLTPTYDGSAKSATVTTNPAGLSGVAITYGGSATAPTTAGTYAVVASLSNANYTAMDATGNLIIGKANQNINFPAFTSKAIGDSDFEPGASVDSGLPLTYTSSNIFVATVYQDNTDGNKWKIKIVGEGITDITALQNGTTNYNSTSALKELTVGLVLPVSFISFDVKLNNTGFVDLTWLTASEKHNSHFIVLKSTDGINFAQLAKISGSGNSDKQNRYQTADKNPANGNNYYQLVQYDTNGKATALATKVVNVKIDEHNMVTVFPNPTQDVVNVKFAVGAFQTVKLVSLNGKVLLSKSIANSQTDTLLNIQNFPAGAYFILLEGKVAAISKSIIKY